MMFHSTRGNECVTASRAILSGIAPDGGLYVPTEIPALPGPLETLVQYSYQELAASVLACYLTDFTESEIRDCVSKAYATFDTPEITPLRQAGDAWYLELFHGRTIAFKDLALSILPHLMTVSARKQGIDDTIVILTATSGDTGKAAMAGFADVPGTEIIVFYPKDGVSPVQERQMVTQTGANTHVIAIRGNFDDAQTGVKQMFSDPALAEDLRARGYRFSSANSINIGRLVPQIVYYIFAYGQMVRDGAITCGETINVTVPTGNFGNILAAWYAKQMGLPIGRLICASNQNRVLTDFFETGRYDRKRPFYTTSSPSMDILVSSNLERLLYHICGCDTAKTADLMQALVSGGVYEIDDSMRAQLTDFFGGCAEEADVSAMIASLYRETGYVIDPHTAVGASVYAKYRASTGDLAPTVIASTASPYKFARSVLHAIDAASYDALDDGAQFDALAAVSGVTIPQAIEVIRNAEVLHDTVVEIEAMNDAVKEILS